MPATIISDTDTLINTEETGGQRDTQVVALTDGGFLVAWNSDGQDGSGYGVYAQQYDASQQPVGNEFRLHTGSAGNQYLAAIEALPDGGFLTAWMSDASGSDIYYLSRYDSTGTSVFSEQALSAQTAFTYGATGASKDSLSIQALDDGRYIVFSVIPSEGQLYDANDQAVGGPFTVESGSTFVKATQLDDGTVVIAYQKSIAGKSSEGFVRHYDPDTNTISAAISVNTTTTADQQLFQLTALGDGGYVVVWQSDGNSSDTDAHGAFGQIFDSGGNKVGGEFQVNTTTVGDQRTPAVTALDDGGFLVQWVDLSGNDGDGSGLFYQRFDAAGLKNAPETVLTDVIVGEQYTWFTDSIATLANGDVVATWASTNFDSDSTAAVAKIIEITPLDATFSGVDTGNVTEDVDPDGDGLLEFSGQLIVSDPNPSEASIQSATVLGSYGSLTIDAQGNWTYAADNAQADVQLLNTGQSLTDIVTVNSADGTEHDITITIDGVNAIAANVGPQIIELLSGGTVSGFSLGFTGVTLGDTVSNGALTFGSDGIISYTPNTGYSGQDGFSYQDGDGLVHEVIIAINEEPEKTNSVLASPDRSQSETFDQLALTALPGGGYATVTALRHEPVNAHREVLLQIFDAYGNKTFADNGITVNQNGAEDQWFADVSVGQDGTIVVTWLNAVDSGSPPDYDVMARLFTSTGTPLTDEFFVAEGDLNSDLSHVNSHLNPDITHLNDGRFVIVGETIASGTGHPHEVWYRVYNSDGSLDTSISGGARTTVFNSSAGDYTDASIAELANGGFIVTATLNDTDIVSKTFNAAGNQTGSSTIISGSSPTDVEVGALKNGDYVIYWSASDGNGLGVFAQLYSADGTLIRDTHLVNSFDQANNQFLPDLVALEGGGYLIAWQSETGVFDVTFYDSGINAQQFDAFGNSVGGLIEIADTNRRGPIVVELESGQVFAGALSHKIVTQAGTSFAHDVHGITVFAASGLNDFLEGTSGNDTLRGLDGDDVLIGLDGADSLNAGGDNDTVRGGGGLDTLRASEGDDLLDGGTGPDTVVYTGAFADYQIVDNGNGNGSTVDLRTGSPDGSDTLVSAEHLQFTDVTTNKLTSVGDITLIPFNEDEDLTITTAELLALSVDLDGDALTVLSVDLVDVTQGTIIDNGNGTWTLTPTEHLSADAVQLTFVVDDGYETVIGNATVDIIAVADEPVITVTPAVGDEDTTLLLDLSVVLADLDGSEALTELLLSGIQEGWELTDGSNIFTATAVTTSIDITSWTLTTLTLTPLENDNGQFDLTVDATSTESSNGDTIQSTLLYPVTVTPVNDLATIDGTFTGAVTEDTDPDTDGLLEVSGTLTVTDIDTGEDQFIVGTITGTYGDITIDAAGNWEYAADNTQATIQNLAIGETLTDVITVSSVDGTATPNITITITGTNDAPELAGDITGAATEDSILTDTGTLILTDLDTSDTHTWAITGDADADGTLAGTHGSFSITQAGTWSYALDNAAAQSLTDGETVTDSFTVTVDDGNGGTETQQVDIIVTGTNDAAVIAGVDTGAVTEDNDPDTDGFLEVSGALSVTDTDTGEASFTVATVVGTYGDITIDAAGNWDYAADNTQAAIQNLAAGSTLTDTIAVTALDGTSHDIAIIINGTDEPVATATTGADTLSGTSSADLIDGLAGNDSIDGNDGNDTIVGGADNDTLSGGSGTDDFIFDANWGTDTITDFDSSNEILDLSATGLLFTDLTITQSGLDTLIEDSSGNSILLENTAVTDIDQADFTF
ncbi:MAG: VCBS domain-containing protein [Kordiimonadaceae bacterium]|nr:VCBS domain-containing protein [Kordiimonadaceae bacterium]